MHCQMLQTTSCVLRNLRGVEFGGMQFNLYDNFMKAQMYVYTNFS